MQIENIKNNPTCGFGGDRLKNRWGRPKTWKNLQTQRKGHKHSLRDKPSNMVQLKKTEIAQNFLGRLCNVWKIMQIADFILSYFKLVLQGLGIRKPLLCNSKDSLNI